MFSRQRNIPYLVSLTLPAVKSEVNTRDMGNVKRIVESIQAGNGMAETIGSSSSSASGIRTGSSNYVSKMFAPASDPAASTSVSGSERDENIGNKNLTSEI